MSHELRTPLNAIRASLPVRSWAAPSPQRSLGTTAITTVMGMPRVTAILPAITHPGQATPRAPATAMTTPTARSASARTIRPPAPIWATTASVIPVHDVCQARTAAESTEKDRSLAVLCCQCSLADISVFLVVRSHLEDDCADRSDVFSAPRNGERTRPQLQPSQQKTSLPRQAD